MEEFLNQSFSQLHGGLLALVIAVSLGVLAKAADWLVGEAVTLSERSGISKAVIGATVVSLGTTTPEAAVSVFAAMQGSPGLALGNAVGSIICNAGLILGLACVLAPLKLDRLIVNRLGWIQLGTAVALVVAGFPWASPRTLFSAGGSLSQVTGFVFLAALAVYLGQSIRWAKDEIGAPSADAPEAEARGAVLATVARLLGALTLVVASARVLIPAVQEAATRLHIPEDIIAATLVAFGTSLPELVTAVAAARRGHGELAVGNVVGANVLNVLFVAGAAAAVTPAGLAAEGHFFSILYPAMLFILTVLQIGMVRSGRQLRRPFGFVLLAAYALCMALSYVIPGGGGTL